MFHRALYLIAVLCLLTPISLLAEESRFVRGEAIINASFQAFGGRNERAASGHQLDRVTRDSFSSLTNERLLDSAVRVSIKRKINGQTSGRYMKSRNPCNTAVIKRLLRTSKLLSCEPNWEVQLTSTPNDHFYSSLYSASTTSAGRINLPGAWDLTTGSSNVVIGIIDTGIDYNHPDLAGNVWTNPGEIAANGLDDDGNGKIDDVHGIDTYNSDSNPFDDQSHGTHVAGTIGAIGNNSIGVVGIAWNVKMIACKAFGASGVASVSSIVNCMSYFVNLKKNWGINIVATSNSYGGFPYTNAMYNAVAATRDADMLFVAGAGNNSSDNESAPFYPASFNLDNIISVAAIDSSGNKAGFSNYGSTSVDIAAPGVSVLSTIPGPNQYAWYNGTSMATPHVTGAVALLLAYHPNYTYQHARSAILNSGRSSANLSGKCATGAILNVEGALKYAVAESPIEAPEIVPTAEPENPPDSSEPDLSTAKLEISVANSRTTSVITCLLSASNAQEDVALPNYRVTLNIKGIKTQRRATSGAGGDVSFNVQPPKRGSYSARCVANLTDPESKQLTAVKSRAVTLKRTRK